MAASSGLSSDPWLTRHSLPELEMKSSDDGGMSSGSEDGGVVPGLPHTRPGSFSRAASRSAADALGVPPKRKRSRSSVIGPLGFSPGLEETLEAHASLCKRPRSDVRFVAAESKEDSYSASDSSASACSSGSPPLLEERGSAAKPGLATAVSRRRRPCEEAVGQAFQLMLCRDVSGVLGISSSMTKHSPPDTELPFAVQQTSGAPLAGRVQLFSITTGACLPFLRLAGKYRGQSTFSLNADDGIWRVRLMITDYEQKDVKMEDMLLVVTIDTRLVSEEILSVKHKRSRGGRSAAVLEPDSTGGAAVCTVGPALPTVAHASTRAVPAYAAAPPPAKRRATMRSVEMPRHGLAIDSSESTAADSSDYSPPLQPLPLSADVPPFAFAEQPAAAAASLPYEPFEATAGLAADSWQPGSLLPLLSPPASPPPHPDSFFADSVTA
eukprot:PLAT3604.5.p1 GENE.PLAT3604.5~~PLAT3604.5.p1  ORF type:complete len:472 (+),score=203.15 PLAT3604.5:101-1417(+)